MGKKNFLEGEKEGKEEGKEGKRKTDKKGEEKEKKKKSKKEEKEREEEEEKYENETKKKECRCDMEKFRNITNDKLKGEGGWLSIASHSEDRAKEWIREWEGRRDRSWIGEIKKEIIKVEDQELLIISLAIISPVRAFYLKVIL